MNAGELRYIIDESIGILWRRKAANIISTIIMALSLLILVTFLSVTLNIAGLIEKTSEEMRVYVYLNDDIDKDLSREMQLRLMAEQGVEEVIFISKEEALVDFRETLGEESDLLDAPDFDYERAGARLLGRDVFTFYSAGPRASRLEKAVQAILGSETDPDSRLSLASDMLRTDPEKALDFLVEFARGINDARRRHG